VGTAARRRRGARALGSRRVHCSLFECSQMVLGREKSLIALSGMLRDAENLKKIVKFK
jgi:hypothetical protein